MLNRTRFEIPGSEIHIKSMNQYDLSAPRKYQGATSRVTALLTDCNSCKIILRVKGM